MSPVRYLALLVCSVLTLAALVGGCAPTSAYVSARQLETAASKFVDVSADAWHAYSHARLENIKDGCADLECFKTVAAQWESGTVAPADKAIVTAREAVHTFGAALDVDGAVQKKDFGAAISALFQAVSALVSILNGYGLSLSAFMVH